MLILTSSGTVEGQIILSDLKIDLQHVYVQHRQPRFQGACQDILLERNSGHLISETSIS